MQFLAKAIALAVFQIQINGAASTASFLPSSFAFWFWQGSIVVGNWLYIDAGEIWARWGGPSTDASPVWNQQTIAIDLSSSWTAASVAATVIVSNKTTAMSPTRRPDLYYDPTKNLVYSLGGQPYQLNGVWYNVSVPVQLWAFEPGDGNVNWELQEVGPTQNFPLTSNVAMALTATSSTGHYNLGGFISFLQGDSIGALALTDMVDFNFANQSWSNQTVSDQHFVYGEAQYVPTFGQEGVVLFFGGNWPSDASVGGSSTLVGLDTILVYDIHSNTFFKQPATNAPIGRSTFCSVGAGENASTNSSYEIFIFGGNTGSDPDSTTAAELSTVYILTLPAFHWLTAPVNATTWRSDHSCSLIGNRQMISIGGVHENEVWQTWTDPLTNGLGIFDLSALSWTNAYDHTAAPYEPSSLVTSYYSSNARYPISWADPALQVIFETNPTSTPTGSSSSPTLNPTGNTGTSSPAPEHGSTGAIAGSVVGGVVAIAMIGVLIFCYLRKKRRSSQTQSPNYLSGPVEMDSDPARRGDLPVKVDWQTMPAVIHEAPGRVPTVYELHTDLERSP